MRKLGSIFLLASFAGLSNTPLSGQSLFIGGQGSLTSFVFSESDSDALAIDAGQIWASPTFGFESSLGEKLHVGCFGGYSVLSNGKELYDGYLFDYALGRLTPFLRYNLTAGFNVRFGIPLAYVLEARQYNNFGELDLLSEGNVPSLLIGSSLEIGYGISFGEKFSLQLHAGYGQYLNSLDTDPEQRLTPYSYLFNAQFHYHL
jgi:hypothetical protein